jgi:hypothetical protein
MRPFARLFVAALAAPSFSSFAACTVHETTAAYSPPPPPPPARVEIVATAAPAPPPPAPPSPRPDAHPAYLHALSDLRNARALLERRGGDPQTKWDERVAVEAIDRAFADIRRAAIDDGKSLQDHPPIDARELRPGRLHEALAALKAARNDVAQEEDNAFASGLRARGLRNIDEAIRFTEQGIVEADQAPRVIVVAPPAAPPPAPPPPAPRPEAHPAYLHALSDLRDARWQLARRGGDPQMKWDERGAVEAIDRAIVDLRQAAMDDGKSLQDHPPVDTHDRRAGRLHRALAALRAARNDVAHEEDNASAGVARGRGLGNIDEAIRFTEQGIAEADRAP